ncbi:MAG: HAD hydrolase-like protein [Candidatus Eremiobacterota bacterium]
MNLLLPCLRVPRLAELEFSRLADRGIVYYCLDVDNTVARVGSWEPAPGVGEALAPARAAGFVRDACLLSNVILGAARIRRLDHLAAMLGIRHAYAARFWDRKPSPRPFRWAMQRMSSDPATTAVVGDQLHTDILGGNRLGLYTVLVKPLGPDHWTTRLTGRRRRERALLAGPDPQTGEGRWG